MLLVWFLTYKKVTNQLLDCRKYLKIEEVEDVVYYGTVDVWHDDVDQ